MIQIKTSDGRFLDIAPDCEFEIKMEQPILSDEHMPVPFSTDISFPPSPKNREILDYMPALMFEPGVKQLQVELVVGGEILMPGSLEFTGIEDGQLEYSFVGRDISERWSQKLAIRGSEDEYAGLWGTTAETLNMPLIINANAVAKRIYDAQGETGDTVEPEIKYRNFRGVSNDGEEAAASGRYFLAVPVLKVSKIFQTISPGLKFPFGTNVYLHQLGILCPYSSKFWYKTKMRNYFGVAPENEPDVTYSDILQGVCKMFCCAAFANGQSLVIKSAKEILTSAPAVDWTEKIADSFSSSVEEAKNYRFKYSNSTDENLNPDVVESGEPGVENKITVLNNIYQVLNKASGEYATYKLPLGDIYSVKGHTSTAGVRFVDADIVHHELGSGDNEIGADSDFDNSCDFELVKCVPDIVMEQDWDNSANPVITARRLMAPVIPVIGTEEPRDNKVFIGLLRAYDSSTYVQMIDKGQFFTKDSYMNTTFGITPGLLYPIFHKDFAEWIGKPHQCIKADLRLSLKDIRNFKLYNTIYIKGRKWLTKELTLTFRADSDSVEANGEFIAL